MPRNVIMVITSPLRKKPDILENSLEETKQLQELIDSLLFLSNSNEKDIQNRFEDIEIDEIIIDILSENKKLTLEKNIVIEFKEFNNTICHGHALLIKILVSNIIQNSLKYSNKDSKIIIDLKDDTLLIEDFGIGIKEDDLKNIFDSFYRVNKARGRGGYGLGLSIVKNIALLHHFKLDVTSTIGTKFIVTFSKSNKSNI